VGELLRVEHFLSSHALLNDLHNTPSARLNKHDFAIDVRVLIGDVAVLGRDCVVLNTLGRQDASNRNRLLILEDLRMLFDHILFETRPFLDSN
jgi:hypothetical protein